jgi:hypothetical protein
VWEDGGANNPASYPIFRPLRNRRLVFGSDFVEGPASGSVSRRVRILLRDLDLRRSRVRLRFGSRRLWSVDGESIFILRSSYPREPLGACLRSLLSVHTG